MSSIVSAKREPGAPSQWWSQPGCSAALLIAAVVLCYWNSLGAPFLFDDAGAIAKNPTIRHLASFAVLNPPANGSTTTNRPILNLSFAVNYALNGERVWSYHALNVAIHALAALVLLGIVRRTLSGAVLRGRFGAAAPWLAFLIALLWALHPLQTETVVCIAQRTESLWSLFFLLTLYGFIRGSEHSTDHAADLTTGTPRHQVGSRPHQLILVPLWLCGSAPDGLGWYALSFSSCLLGMGTKEVMAAAPLLVLLYDRTFVAGGFSAAWRQRRTYYVALASTWLLLVWILLSAGGSRGLGAGYGLGVSWWTYLLKQSQAIVLYLKLSFWPHPLVVDYGTAVVRSVADVWWQATVVLALLLLTIWALIRKPSCGFLGAWFFVILAPSSSVMPIVTQTMAEHRMYLPLAAVVCWVVLTLYRWVGSRAAWLMGVAVVGLGFVTIARNYDYLDVVAIWADTVAKYPQNARAHNNLAWALLPQGKTAEANAHFARAVELQPDYVTGHYNWGVTLLDQGRIAEAITQLETAVRLAPIHADAHVNLGNALLRAQRAADAIPHYETALRLQPAADIHYDLGVALMAVGRDEEAAAHFQSALDLDRALPEAHYQLARVAERAGRVVDAERGYNQVLQLAPGHAGAHARLGLLLAHSGRLPAAVEHLRAAVRLAPADADAHAFLGVALLLQDQPREAIASFEESLRLRPDDNGTRENLQLARESLH